MPSPKSGKTLRAWIWHGPACQVSLTERTILPRPIVRGGASRPARPNARHSGRAGSAGSSGRVLDKTGAAVCNAAHAAIPTDVAWEDGHVLAQIDRVGPAGFRADLGAAARRRVPDPPCARPGQEAQDRGNL